MPEWMVRLRVAITTHKGFPLEMKIGVASRYRQV
jgi:hypothetical protein